MAVETSLTLNASGVMCRTETLMGREWIVANMTLIVPGVLPGSEGPLLYPKEEINRNVMAWNHIPITNGHPVLNGKPITARAPEVLDTYSMGVLLNAKGGDRLTAEGWFDVALTKKLNPLVYAKLEQGQKIELSTGLSVDRQSVLNGKTETGQEYSGIVSNFRPDHLAVLTNVSGACSLEDGCGVNNEKKEEEVPSKESMVTSLWNAMFSKMFIRNELSHENIRTELRKQLTERFSTGILPNSEYPSSLWVMDVFKSYVVFSWDDKFWKMSYSSKGNTVSLDEGKPEEVVQVTDYKTVTNTGEGQMAMTIEEKEVVINQILGKCGCEDKKVLNALSDEALKSMQSAIVANTVAKTAPASAVVSTTPTPAPAQFVLPPELTAVINYVQDLQGREKTAIINRLTSHITDATAKAAVVQGYEAMTVAQLSLVANSLPTGSQPAKKTADFSAAGSDIQNKAGQGEVKETGLDIPVINYEQEAKIGK